MEVHEALSLLAAPLSVLVRSFSTVEANSKMSSIVQLLYFLKNKITNPYRIYLYY